MKAIILAGGYGKRLWPLTKYIPKALLDVGGKLMIDHIIEKLENIQEIDTIIVSTNEMFDEPLREWIKDKRTTSKKKIKLIIEPTKDEGGKFGTISGLQYIVEEEDINDDCLIVASDNLFDFDIRDFIKFFKEKKSPVIAVFDIKDKQKAMIYGIVTIDENKKVIDFAEKPTEPPSTLASTACYLFPKDVMRLFGEYIEEGGRKDSPGFFLTWLHKKQNVYAFTFSGHWFDIGDFESLDRAREFMKNLKGGK